MYRLETEQVDAEAQNNLRFMYGNGFGVLQNYRLADMWCNIAGSNGYELSIKYKNIIEKQMPEQQIKKAKETTRSW